MSDERYCDDKLTMGKMFSSAPTAIKMAGAKVKESRRLGDYLYIFALSPDTDMATLTDGESEMIGTDLSTLKSWFEAHPPVKKWKLAIDKPNGIIRIHDTADPDGTDRYAVVCDNLTVGCKRLKKAIP